MSGSKVCTHESISREAPFMPHPAQPRQEIEITMPDGSKRKGTSWETSPMDIAREISKGLADRIVIAKVPTVCPPGVALVLILC